LSFGRGVAAPVAAGFAEINLDLSLRYGMIWL